MEPSRSPASKVAWVGSPELKHLNQSLDSPAAAAHLHCAKPDVELCCTAERHSILWLCHVRGGVYLRRGQPEAGDQTIAAFLRRIRAEDGAPLSELRFWSELSIFFFAGASVRSPQPCRTTQRPTHCPHALSQMTQTVGEVFTEWMKI